MTEIDGVDSRARQAGQSHILANSRLRGQPRDRLASPESARDVSGKSRAGRRPIECRSVARQPDRLAFMTARNQTPQLPQKRDRARRADVIAREQGGLGQALRRAEAYMALNARLAELIPEAARGEIMVACVDGDCLVIAAASSTRATQARLLANSLLEAARRHWPGELTRSRIIVTPEIGRTP